MRRRILLAMLGLPLLIGGSGCQHPSISAVAVKADACGPECGSFWGILHHCTSDKPQGIPFYMPKPLLIISKNFRNLEETKLGLSDGAPIPNYFDDQSKYADLNSRSTFLTPNAVPEDLTPLDPKDNGEFKGGKDLASVSTARVYSGKTGAPLSPLEAPDDGLAPKTFYTYHIMFVPDLTRKYGLKVKGGVGEFRAAMNLVNGWQFTGLGPFYLKDSSTAQDVLASGIAANLTARGVSDVISNVANMAKAFADASGQSVPPIAPSQAAQVVSKIRAFDAKAMNIENIGNYAQIWIYEPNVSLDGRMEWNLIVHHDLSRQAIGKFTKTPATSVPSDAAPPAPLEARMPGAFPFALNPLAAATSGKPGVQPDGGELPRSIPMLSGAAAQGRAIASRAKEKSAKASQRATGLTLSGPSAAPAVGTTRLAAEASSPRGIPTQGTIAPPRVSISPAPGTPVRSAPPATTVR